MIRDRRQAVAGHGMMSEVEVMIHGRGLSRQCLIVEVIDGVISK